MAGLAAAFLSRWKGPPPSDVAALEQALETALSQGESAWPGLALSREEFVGFLAERGVEAAAIVAQRAADLYLSRACATGDPRALEAFERRYLANVAGYVARVRRDASFADDVRQELREKLFVGTSRRGPRIGEYAGVGALESWVRVAAVRVALDLVEHERPYTPLDEPTEDFLGATGDPELDYVKVRYATDFRNAFGDALADLEVEERSMLRLYVIEGLDIGSIGRLFGVSRATIGRRVVDVRKKLLERTRARLGARIEASPREVDSLIGALGSRLDLSLRRFLAVE